MAKTAVQITDAEMAVYRATAQQREAQEHEEQKQRIQRALTLAQEAANLLREDFGVRQVILFGSLARRTLFHRRSDIDLVIEGIKNQDFWHAWSALDRFGSEFEIDLMDIETASPSLRSVIEQEGVEL